MNGWLGDKRQWTSFQLGTTSPCFLWRPKELPLCHCEIRVRKQFDWRNEQTEQRVKAKELWDTKWEKTNLQRQRSLERQTEHKANATAKGKESVMWSMWLRMKDYLAEQQSDSSTILSAVSWILWRTDKGEWRKTQLQSVIAMASTLIHQDKRDRAQE